MSSLSNILNPTDEVFVSPPSLKSLGKRRAISPSPLSTIPALDVDIASIKPNLLEGRKGKEKRITRSSIGGPADAKQSRIENNNTEGLDTDSTSPNLSLPLETSVVLTLKPIPNLIYNSTFQTTTTILTSISTPGAPADDHEFFSENVAPNPSTSTIKPSYRLLDKNGDAVYGKSRHVAASLEIDTSDAHYQRLHRYPEVLEKRSTRLERDKLIHERSKLILEIEEIKSRSWVYYPQGGANANQNGSSRDENRRQRLKEKEERLQRYDALLPNQPRRSGALSNTSVNGSSTATNLDSRGNSPALIRPLVSNLSASPVASGATSIRIKFKGNNSDSVVGGQGKNIILKSKRSKYLEMESEDDQVGITSQDENQTIESSLQHQHLQSKPLAKPRDRQAERERASQRVAGEVAAGSSRKRSRNDGDSRVKGSSTSAISRRVKQRQLDSFYSSAELRSSVMDTFSLSSTSAIPKNRRASSRLSYAFGQRIPDHILAQQSEFELHGGGPGEKLEDMVLRRSNKIKRSLAGEEGKEYDEGEVEATRVFGGVVVPASAMSIQSRIIVIPVTNKTTPSESSLSSALDTPEPEEQEDAEDAVMEVDAEQSFDGIDSDGEEVAAEVIELVNPSILPVNASSTPPIRSTRHSNRTEKVSYISQ